jgi:hypothetical protein
MTHPDHAAPPATHPPIAGPAGGSAPPSGTTKPAPEGSYRRRPYEPGPPPTFSYDVVVVTGEKGAELRAAQARATKELFSWLHEHRHRRTEAEP